MAFDQFSVLIAPKLWLTYNVVQKDASVWLHLFQAWKIFSIFAVFQEVYECINWEVITLSSRINKVTINSSTAVKGFIYNSLINSSSIQIIMVLTAHDHYHHYQLVNISCKTAKNQHNSQFGTLKRNLSSIDLSWTKWNTGNNFLSTWSM